MWKADALDTACGRAGTWLSPPSRRGRAGAAQPRECGHRVPELPTSRSRLHSPDRAADTLLPASPQGLGLGRGLWGNGGLYLSRVQAPAAIKAVFTVRRGSERRCFDGGLGAGWVGLAPRGSLLLPSGTPAGPRRVQLLIDPHPHPHVWADTRPTQTCVKTQRWLLSGTKEGADESSCRQGRAQTLRQRRRKALACVTCCRAAPRGSIPREAPGDAALETQRDKAEGTRGREGPWCRSRSPVAAERPAAALRWAVRDQAPGSTAGASSAPRADTALGWCSPPTRRPRVRTL